MTVDAGGGAQTPETDPRVLWTARLPAADAGELMALPDGGCLVATRQFLAAVRPPGEVAWLVETGPGWSGSPVLLPDGGVARREGDRLVVRDAGTGRVLVSWPEPSGAGLAVAPDGDLVHSRWSGDRGGELCKVAPDGTLRWSRPLAGRLGHAPTVDRQRILVGDGSYVRAYDLDGALLWVAGRDGFQMAGPADLAARPSPVTDPAAGPVVVLDDDLFVAELRWYAGSGLYRFDLQSATVDQLKPPIAVHPPVAPLRRPGQAPAIALLGPAERDADGAWRWTVVALDTGGRVEWTVRTPVEPRLLMPGEAGQLLVLSSPDLDRWQKYHDWYDLSRECAIRCFGWSGQELWTWYAPHPISYRPAVGLSGEIYAGVPGAMWALGARSEAEPA